MVSQKEGLILLSRMERLAFIRERHKRLILDARGEAEIGPIEIVDEEDDVEEPSVDVALSDFDCDEN